MHLQNIGNNILKAGGSKKAVYNAFKAAPMSIGLESLGESATQITQNVADILIFGDFVEVATCFYCRNVSQMHVIFSAWQHN